MPGRYAAPIGGRYGAANVAIDRPWHIHSARFGPALVFTRLLFRARAIAGLLLKGVNGKGKWSALSLLPNRKK